MKYIAQETPMGCGVACVANLLQISYKKALKLFDKPKKHVEKGFYCREIINALEKVGLDYDFRKISCKTKHYLKKNNIIVFVKEGKDDIYGHYFVKTEKEWIDSWSNWPMINPAKAGLRKKLPGKPLWVIYPK